MRTVSASDITRTIARLCVEANTKLPPDVAAALSAAREAEPWPLAKQTLGLLQDNLDLALQKNLPICQDTGMACVFAEIGQGVHIEGNFETAVSPLWEIPCTGSTPGTTRPPFSPSAWSPETS